MYFARRKFPKVLFLYAITCTSGIVISVSTNPTTTIFSKITDASKHRWVAKKHNLNLKIARLSQYRYVDSSRIKQKLGGGGLGAFPWTMFCRCIKIIFLFLGVYGFIRFLSDGKLNCVQSINQSLFIHCRQSGNIHITLHFKNIIIVYKFPTILQ